MAVSRNEIVEAIKADLIRDQEEIQEIQQKLIALQERTRVNRAWLKAYGFGEHVATSVSVSKEETESPVRQPVEPQVNISASINDVLAETVALAAPAVEVEDSNAETVVETSSVLNAHVQVTPEPVPDSSSSPLKAEGRKKLYDALISRGARIQG